MFPLAQPALMPQQSPTPTGSAIAVFPLVQPAQQFQPAPPVSPRITSSQEPALVRVQPDTTQPLSILFPPVSLVVPIVQGVLGPVCAPVVPVESI